MIDPNQRTVSRTQLERWEDEWSSRLGAVSLVAEAEIDHEHAVTALKAVRHANPGSRPSLRDWPACIAIGMVAIAAEDYEAGSYWSAFFHHLGEWRDQNVQSAFSDAFLAALAKFELPYKTDGGQTYLGPLTLHAAVPTYCLGDLLQLLLKHDRRTAGHDGEAFVAWATGIGAPTRLNSLDVPVRRFLRAGAEFSIDVIDRLLEMLRALQGGETELRWTGLPVRMLDEAMRLRAAGELDLATRRARRSSNTAEGDPRPAVRLDVSTGAVVVRLPPVGEAPDGRAVWRVLIDGHAETVASNALWPGSHEPAPATQMIVRHPARSAAVSLDGSELSYELDLVDAQDPLLVFEDDGRAVPASAALPTGHAWLLQPDETALDVTGDLSNVAEAPPPLGWEGWTLRLVSLDGVESLSAGVRRRWVRRTARARFEFSELALGVTTRYGLPVYAGPPTVFLPGIAGAPVTWTVTIRDAGSGSVVSNNQYEVRTSAEVRADPFDGLQRPLLGSFDVSVRGPLGSGQERRVSVAEGLRTRCSRGYRAFTSTGLTPTTVHVSVPHSMSVSPCVREFGEQDLTQTIEVNVGDSRETLYVTPPHMSVARVSARESGTWSSRPIRESVESLSDPGRLVLQVPAELGVPSLRVRAAERNVQHLEPSGRRVPGQATYELTRVVDTIQSAGRGELVIDLDDMVVPVASFRPRRLATACSIEGGELVFTNFAGISDVNAAVYSYLAPWREPIVLRIDHGGGVLLPDDCVDAGPLAVLLRLDDPWLPEPWPAWPEDGSAFFVRQPGAPRLDRPSEADLVDYLVGTRSVPDERASFPYLWSALHRRRALQLAGVHREIRRDIAAVVQRHPSRALDSLVEVGLDASDVVKLVVKTGLASLAPSSEIEVLRQLWQLYPAAACLADVRSDDLPLEAVERQCGDVALTILGGTDDPFRKSGVFDAFAQRLEGMTPAQVDQVWSAARVVPEGLLDADSRAAAARELFDRRNHPRLRRLTEVARPLLDDGQATLRSGEAPPASVAWINARRGGQSARAWVDLPALSAILACLARRAARGDDGSHSLIERAQRYWALLAATAPGLVAADIVLAELLERGHSEPILATKGADSDDEY